MSGSVRKLPKVLNQLDFSQNNRFNTIVAVPGFIMQIWLCAVVGAAGVEILKGSLRTGEETLALPVEAPVWMVSSVHHLEGRVEPFSCGVEPQRNRVETTGTRVASASGTGTGVAMGQRERATCRIGAQRAGLSAACVPVSNPHGLQRNGSAFSVLCSYLRSTNLIHRNICFLGMSQPSQGDPEPANRPSIIF